MHTNLARLDLIKNKVNEIVKNKQLKVSPNIIAVTKTFDLDNITPIIESGHLHFGENKIQEAENKWDTIKSKNKNIQLHMVGNLQSNKAKKAVKIFDYVHSLDNEKLAQKLSKCESELDKKIKYFIQINLGNESQKSGISLKNLNEFYQLCSNDLCLNVIGLMCLPPSDSDSMKYFIQLKNASKNINLQNLSMGMSSDYENAILAGSTFLRIGTAIFGKRNS